MPYITFSHDATLTLPVGPAGGEDSIEVEVRLHCEGKPGTREYIPPYNRPDLYDPGSGPEIVLLSVEISDDEGETYRPAVKTMSPDGDDAVIAAAEAYVDDLPDSLVTALHEAMED